MRILVSGASEDCLEIDGDHSDERYGERFLLTFGDGTKLKVEYGPDGTACWRVEVVEQGSASVEKIQVGDDDAEDKGVPNCARYSDVVVVEGAEVKAPKIRKLKPKVEAI